MLLVAGGIGAMKILGEGGGGVLSVVKGALWVSWGDLVGWLRVLEVS
jgi:hypothetical protein